MGAYTYNAMRMLDRDRDPLCRDLDFTVETSPIKAKVDDSK